LFCSCSPRHSAVSLCRRGCLRCNIAATEPQQSCNSSVSLCRLGSVRNGTLLSTICERAAVRPL
jgi:hypothetical protein